MRLASGAGARLLAAAHAEGGRMVYVVGAMSVRTSAGLRLGRKVGRGA